MNHNSSEEDPFKFYFQIDTEWMKKYMDSLINKIEYQWISKDILEEVFDKLSKYNTPLLPEGFSPISLPVNDCFSNTAEGKSSLYLGNNHYNEPMYIKQNFLSGNLKRDYVNHLQSNVVHFINQPQYYKSLFDILN